MKSRLMILEQHSTLFNHYRDFRSHASSDRFPRQPLNLMAQGPGLSSTTPVVSRSSSVLLGQIPIIIQQPGSLMISYFTKFTSFTKLATRNLSDAVFNQSQTIEVIDPTRILLLMAGRTKHLLLLGK